MLDNETITKIAVPLTGWVITRSEAQTAYAQLSVLSDRDFELACARLAAHSFGAEGRENKVERLIKNLGGRELQGLQRRFLGIATQEGLAAAQSAAEFPYMEYVKVSHRHLLDMGLSISRALALLDDAIAGGEFGPSFHHAYRDIFGTDNSVGWDKAMHFVKSAWLSYNFGPGLSYRAGLSKEAYDEFEQSLGKDPEGWSEQDIVANSLGVVWGRELAQ